MAEDSQSDITALTVQLLSAFVANNSVPSESLADLIKSTRDALTNDVTEVMGEPTAETVTPAVSVRKSLSSPDHVLSLIDGKPYKTLKRHLAKHGLTPEQYRERYGLPKTYPMVAQSYSAARRAVAERLGLGKRPAVAAEAVKPAELTAPASVKPAGTTSSKPSAPKERKPAKARAASTKPVLSVAEAADPTEVKDAAPTKMAPVTADRARKTSKNLPAAKKGPRKRLSIAATKQESS